MRESRSSGSVGERGGNEPLYPDDIFNIFTKYKEKYYHGKIHQTK
jgi:hypothetical protein